jgi:hypothetical protein
MHRTCVSYASKLWFFGGVINGEPSNELAVFTPPNTFEVLPYQEGAPSPRYHHTAALFANRMIVVGGKDNNSHTFNDVYVYDFALSKWSKKYDVTPRYGHSMVTLGKWIIIYGGKAPKHQDIEIIDASSWEVDFHPVLYGSLPIHHLTQSFIVDRNGTEALFYGGQEFSSGKNVSTAFMIKAPDALNFGPLSDSSDSHPVDLSEAEKPVDFHPRPPEMLRGQSVALPVRKSVYPNKKHIPHLHHHKNDASAGGAIKRASTFAVNDDNIPSLDSSKKTGRIRHGSIFSQEPPSLLESEALYGTLPPKFGNILDALKEAGPVEESFPLELETHEDCATLGLASEIPPPPEIQTPPYPHSNPLDISKASVFNCTSLEVVLEEGLPKQ